jgi:radical SAM protein with 4Fe4S-binding SPASM domain
MSEQGAIIDLRVADAGYTKDLYSSIDCYISYRFARFEVDGAVKPCCVYPYSAGNFLEEDWRKIWHASAMAEFRKKTATMSEGKWHLTTAEWSFCQNCSHRDLNVEADEVLKRPLAQEAVPAAAPKALSARYPSFLGVFSRWKPAALFRAEQKASQNNQ